MDIILSGILTVFLGIFLLYVYKRRNTIVYYRQGKWWLTWFSLGVITLMDELTSIFYAPAEAFRFIGYNAIFFIAFTSLFIRFLSTRMVEISEILERNKIKGGGVYSFSYIVLGPTISFIAVASIYLTYILTASISSVSAAENGLALFPILSSGKIFFALGIIWFITYLNIIGIKDNAKFTCFIFIVAMLVFLNLIFSSFYKADQSNWITMLTSIKNSVLQFKGYSFPVLYIILIGSVSSCILAYSGVESVIQSAGYVKSWRDIAKAYVFLALTVGIITPIISAFVLSSKIDFKLHETDLITYYATVLNGIPFGLIVSILASILLTMAINTAFVASSELLEKVCERYSLTWLIKTNSKQSLYRIHLLNGIIFSLVVIFTGGSQKILAEMYAIGLLASFSINMLCLIIYRYFYGTKEIPEYHTSRTGTVLLFIILFSCFLWLSFNKIYGMILWLSFTAFFITVGLIIAKRRAPEIVEIHKTDNPMDIILYISELKQENINIYFVRSAEKYFEKQSENDIFINFYLPREGTPEKLGENHFRLQVFGYSLIHNIIAILWAIKYELENKKITIHFGWPMSSWWDRLSTTVMIYNITQLPKMFPEFNFQINYISLSK